MPSRNESGLWFEPLPADIRRESSIGAEVHLPASGPPVLDLATLTEADKDTLRQALFENQVIVLRNQTGIDPTTLPALTRIFDPTASDIHSAGEKAVSDPRNILSAYKAGRLPCAPQVGIIGSGVFKDYKGIPELEVIHLDHTTFHEEPLSAEKLAEGYTRPYRWHMDTPFYERLPGEVTILHAVQVPQLPDQKLSFPDGSEEQIAAGATAFFSGARAFELLTPEQQEFALNTTVTYAPQAYEYIRHCKATEDGMTIPSMGRETKAEDMSEWQWDKVAEHPMVWRNPGSDRPFLQVHGCCVYKLTTRDPATGALTVMDDVDKVRATVYAMQRRIWQAGHIYAHRWQEGDLVVFHNRGVMHSITGQLAQYQKEARVDEAKKRLMWQCTMTSGTAPKAYRKYAGVNETGFGLSQLTSTPSKTDVNLANLSASCQVLQYSTTNPSYGGPSLATRPLPPGRIFLFGYLEFHHRFGFIRIGSYKFYWRKVLRWNSPLLLRYSWQRLHCAYELASPLRAYLRILWPFPRKWPCGPLPPPPRLLLADGKAVETRYYRDYHVQIDLPVWRNRDTLQAAFYRLYEAICAADDIMIGYITEYMFFRPEPEWTLDRLTDPRTMTGWDDLHDTNAASFAGSGTGRLWTETEQAERLAVMARIALSLEEVFNWRLGIGLRRDGTVVDKQEDLPDPIWTPVQGPSWPHDVPGLPELLLLSHTPSDGYMEPGWKPRYNIIMKKSSMRTV